MISSARSPVGDVSDSLYYSAADYRGPGQAKVFNDADHFSFLAMMNISYNERILDFSDHFILSSGTVTIDYDKDLVLLLYHRSKAEYLLPKGRKNIGETLQATAKRETWEESGYICQLHEHNLPTKATQSLQMPHTEPFAIQQRSSDGIRKIIFWHVGMADSSARPVVGTREEGEDFEARWMSSKDALSILSFEEDRKIVERALCAFPCQSHYDLKDCSKS